MQYETPAAFCDGAGDMVHRVAFRTRTSQLDFIPSLERTASGSTSMTFGRVATGHVSKNTKSKLQRASLLVSDTITEQPSVESMAARDLQTEGAENEVATRRTQGRHSTLNLPKPGQRSRSVSIDRLAQLFPKKHGNEAS